MPLDVLGRTRATLTHAASFPCPKGLGNLVNVCRDRDRLLQLLILNEEFLVNAGHQLALITSLPFVHTARRTYRLNDSMKLSDRDWDALGRPDCGKLFKSHHLEEGEVVTRFP
jgi:predicted oxidoreductase